MQKLITMYKRAFIYLTLLPLCILVLILSIVKINRAQIKPTKQEIDLISAYFGNIKINTPDDIIKIQNMVVDKIHHEFNGKKEIIIENIIKKNSGFCYDRSLLLQKVMLFNGYEIRPVYIFFNHDKTKWTDFFKRELPSHNVFEFKLKTDGKYYLMRTNHKMEKFETLDEYLESSAIVPPHSKVIRHLNNRHGRFIYPSYIPDIY